MIKEQIEQAAKQAIHECYNCNGVFPCIHKDECKYNNGHNTSYDCAECGADDFNKGFIKGADWRINSVWHTNTEMPSIGIDEYGSGKDCLVKPKYGIIEIGQVLFDEGIYVISCNNTTYTMDEIEAWAYLDDLLPQK